MNDAPLTRIYNLGRLPQTGETLVIAATEAERADIARWADLLGVGKWEATVALKKLSTTRFSLESTLVADLTQACVVTLEPVPAHIERGFTRELVFIGAPRRGDPEPGLVILDGEDAPDEIESLHYDVAGPLLEEFSLALDPYPRAPGVRFEGPSEPQAPPKSPFAVLKGLKSGR